MCRFYSRVIDDLTWSFWWLFIPEVNLRMFYILPWQVEWMNTSFLYVDLTLPGSHCFSNGTLSCLSCFDNIFNKTFLFISTIFSYIVWQYFVFLLPNDVMLNLRKERTYSFIQLAKGEYKTWTIYLLMGKCIMRLQDEA
jgi:hypothetical protein